MFGINISEVVGSFVDNAYYIFKREPILHIEVC